MNYCYHMENPIFVHDFNWKVSKFLSELSRLHDPSAHKFKGLHTFKIRSTCIYQQYVQFLNTWLWEIGEFILQLWFNESLHFRLSLGWSLAILSVGSMPSVLISLKKTTSGMAVWRNDELKWNANLGLVSDNDKCSAKAFISSISAFHLEIKLGFGSTFISQPRLLNQPWWLCQQNCVKEP